MLNQIINFYFIILDSILNLNVCVLKTIFNVYLNDAPYPWQIAFQDPASPGFIGIFDLHDNIFFYLVLILFGVM